MTELELLIEMFKNVGYTQVDTPPTGICCEMYTFSVIKDTKNPVIEGKCDVLTLSRGIGLRGFHVMFIFNEGKFITHGVLE